MVILALTASFVVGVAATPAAAGDAHYRVQIDAHAPPGEPWAFNRMFPAQLRVHRGDDVKFAWAGDGTPHTSSVVPAADANQWRADNQGPGDPYEPNISDLAVGGDDNDIIDNPAVDLPSSFVCGSPGAPACSFDGSAVVNSGLQFGDPDAEPSFSVSMDAPVGGYSFLCMIHPGMQIPVTVVGRSTAVPTPQKVAQRTAAQVAKAIAVDAEAADEQAQQVTSTVLEDGRTQWNLNAGGFSNGVSANEFPDDQPLSVEKGDRIHFAATNEIHTISFPFGSVFDADKQFINTVCEQTGADAPATSPSDCASPADFQIVVNPTVLFPTKSNELINPGRFVNSGLIVGPQESTFIAARRGSYSYVCLVHGPQMSGSITIV
jgi:plastocyanin